jgi:hypothetical protein
MPRLIECEATAIGDDFSVFEVDFEVLKHRIGFNGQRKLIASEWLMKLSEPYNQVPFGPIQSHGSGPAAALPLSPCLNANTRCDYDNSETCSP